MRPFYALEEVPTQASDMMISAVAKTKDSEVVANRACPRTAPSTIAVSRSSSYPLGWTLIHDRFERCDSGEKVR